MENKIDAGASKTQQWRLFRVKMTVEACAVNTCECCLIDAGGSALHKTFHERISVGVQSRHDPRVGTDNKA